MNTNLEKLTAGKLRNSWSLSHTGGWSKEFAPSTQTVLPTGTEVGILPRKRTKPRVYNISW
jgi:hypothetical protein